MAHGSKAGEIREAIAEKLASGESVEHAVCGSKCTPRTVYRWLRDDLDFQLLVEEIRQEVLEETRGLRIAAARRASRRLMNTDFRRSATCLSDTQRDHPDREFLPILTAMTQHGMGAL